MNTSSTLLDSFLTFGDLLKYLRRRARLTQSELAAAVGYSREQIAKLENHQRRPDPTIVAARFVSALDLQYETDWSARLLYLAETAREAQLADSLLPIALAPVNFPVPLTRFIGRTREMEEVQRLLKATRLLTLVGTGGAGKTRLALEVGAVVAPLFADGVWLMELAALTEPAGISTRLTALFGLPAESNRALEVTLTHYLRGKHLLLILDNCEHLLAACASLAQTLLQAAPGLIILSTSREPLGMLGETVWRIPSLALPDHDEISTVAQSEAVRLFVDRATAARPAFALTAQIAPSVAQICRRLDGIPLALELAASRVRMLSVEQIAARLDDRFQLLATDGANRTALPRHQTLRALVDWSYALLTETEQRLLRWLAVFVGGWALEAAETVTQSLFPIAEVFDTLADLIDKSLVVVEEHATETRYHLLETIRAYAGARLIEAGELNAARDAHLRWGVQFAERAGSYLRGPQQRFWYQRCEAERENIQAALNWAVEREQATSALRLIGALWYFWFWRGPWQASVERAQAALALRPQLPTRERAWALIGASELAGRGGDFAQYVTWLAEGTALAEALHDDACLRWARLTFTMQMEDYAEAARRLAECAVQARAAGDDWQAAEALFMLGDRARGVGELLQAETAYTQSAALYRRVGDQDMLANPLGNLGRLALERGDDVQAQAAFEESIALFRAANNRLGVANWQIQLARLAVRREAYAQARNVLAECLPIFQDIGDKEALADGLIVGAGLAQSTQHAHRAVKLLAAASVLLENSDWLHRVVDASGYADYEHCRAAARAQLDAATFEAAWAVGLTMTAGEAIEQAVTQASEPAEIG